GETTTRARETRPTQPGPARSLRTQQRAGTSTLHPDVPTAKLRTDPRSSPDAMSNVPPMSTPQRRTLCQGFLDTRKCQMLLRKEVIQPHLPVRLPCYDLVLITDPTFDGSLHKGWATGFRCYRLS